MYVDIADADEDEIAHANDQRWPIGSGSAYPRIIRAGDGDQTRQINDQEAHLLTLAMDGLARFCFAESERLAAGDIPLAGEVLVRDGDQLVLVAVSTPAEAR